MTRHNLTLLSFFLLTLSTFTLSRPLEASKDLELHNRATTVSVGVSTLPASPTGATLLQFKSCASTLATVPMFVNSQYVKSPATAAYIVQHGEGENFDKDFSTVYGIIGTSGIIAAPANYLTSDAGISGNWYQPLINLAWYDVGNWTIGSDAIGPTTGTNALKGAGCSSFDTYDALLTQFSNKLLYPNLKQIYFVGHSAGGNMLSRYSQIYNGTSTFSVRYIIANPASQAYFTNARPDTNPCYGANYYPNQWVKASKMGRYVLARFTNGTAIFQRWATRDVVSLVGDLDTNALYPGGTQDCGSVSEGGANRRDRNYAWWAYTNILAGTGVNVTAYTGYQQLLATGAKSIVTSGTKFNHQNCVIDGVGHVTATMLTSACGRAALTQQTIPAGVGAKYP